ncbi:MAG: family 16 glycosylhydrolase [Saprospiraceae bacterium]|nr:family 16 glycosylhydrolase [Saprospiraceae bacterium]
MSASGTLTFATGETEKTIDIALLGDACLEADELFTISLSNPENGSLKASSILATILNDDVPSGEAGYTSPDSYAGYTLVWADEFNGPSIDLTNWTYDIGRGSNGWGNNELQYYTDRPANNYIEDGKLVIEAKQESFGGASYTSSRLKTQGLQSFKFGRIDIRAKLPYGKGIWPALWMLGDNINAVSWPKCGEIDIMEVIGSEPNKLHGTVHWDNNGSHAQYGQSTLAPSCTFADEYHVFSLIWDEQSIKWLLDDVQYNVVDITPSGLSEFKENFFFIFNVAVGGNWPGSPDGSTKFPQQMKVDYVRVFQQ